CGAVQSASIGSEVGRISTVCRALPISPRTSSRRSKHARYGRVTDCKAFAEESIHASHRHFAVGQACAGRARHRYRRALGGERGPPHQRGTRSGEGGNRSRRARHVADAAARSAYRRMARDVTLLTRPRYSPLIAFSRMSLPQRAISCLRKWAKPSGVLGEAVTPACASLRRTSASVSAAWKAPLSLAMTAGAVPAGASVPAHWLATVSEKPCSTKVGTSGKMAERSCDVAASALSLPALTCAMTVGTSPNRPSSRPPKRSVTACDAPR